jgi:NAD(P)-dependent dehydrogenase (short-subunit alcohol dehydrogenase family)
MSVRDRFLDKSLLGYTSLGYRWRSHSSIDADLTGRTAVVTGATSGLGKQTATELARLGATVQLVGRNRDKTEQVATGITEQTGSAAVGVEVADLSLMSDVRALAKRIEAQIHILVNNAGVLLPTRTETAEGIETTFATNLLGHFLLTNLLVPKLAASARIINIASGGMYAQRISVTDLQNACGTYDGAKGEGLRPDKAGPGHLDRTLGRRARSARRRRARHASRMGRHAGSFDLSPTLLQAHKAAFAKPCARCRYHRLALRRRRSRTKHRQVLARPNTTPNPSIRQNS